MIGGFYVSVVDPSENHPPREYVALVAGPFATWAEANKIGPAAVKHVEANGAKEKLFKPEYGICEFYYHRLVLGIRNGPLWVKPTPVTK